MTKDELFAKMLTALQGAQNSITKLAYEASELDEHVEWDVNEPFNEGGYAYEANKEVKEAIAIATKQKSIDGGVVEAFKNLIEAAATVDNLHHAGMEVDDRAWSTLYNAVNHAKAFITVLEAFSSR